MRTSAEANSWFLLLVSLNCIDAVSTAYAVGGGLAEELNPFLAWAFSVVGIGPVLIIKTLALPPIIRYVATAASGAALTLCAAMYGVVVSMGLTAIVMDLLQ